MRSRRGLLPAFLALLPLAAAAELEAHPAALVHDEVAADLLRVLLAEPLGALVGAHLLVGGNDHEQLAFRPPARAGERCRRCDLGRDLALHVLGAAAPDHLVGEVAAPWVMRPVLGVGGDGIDVPEQWVTGAAAPEFRSRFQVFEYPALFL